MQHANDATTERMTDCLNAVKIWILYKMKNRSAPAGTPEGEATVENYDVRPMNSPEQKTWPYISPLYKGCQMRGPCGAEFKKKF